MTQPNTRRDIVCIENLIINATIGVHAWEQMITQPIHINLALYTNLDKACKSDDIADALDYQKVCEHVQDICANHRPALLEHLAHLILEHLFAHFACQSIKISLKKPLAIKNAQVGISLLRHKKDYD